jgi:DNA primase
MKTQGVSLPHAVQILKEGASLAGERVGVTRSLKRHLPVLAADGADDQALLRQVVDYYHASLKQNPQALAYLQGRGLTHPDLIDTFCLGLANKTLTYRLAPSHTLAGKESRKQLQRLGILRSSGHEHFNGCLVVPVIGCDGAACPEQSGRVMQLYGRRLNDAHLSAADPRHLYLPRPLAGIWNEAALAADHEIILCEALIDAMTFWCAGFRNVITAYGVNGFSAGHREALKHYGTRRVLIAFDRDEAGNTAADKLAVELMESGIECFRVLFPKGMDANDYAQKVKPAQKSLGLALKQAQWLGKGKRSSVTPRVAPETRQAAPEIESESEPVAPDTSSLAAAEVEFAPSPSEAPSETDPPSTEPIPAQGELLLSQGERHWRIRGWQKNLSPEQMRVNVQVRRETEQTGNLYHVDTFDLYSAKQRAAYIHSAALELKLQEEVIKRDIGQLLLKLEMMQDALIAQTTAPRQSAPRMTPREEASALDLLKSPELTTRLVEDMQRCGVVGEEANLLAGYLASISRKLPTPLAVLIQSSSAAGKSSLMDAVLNFVPEEERIRYSAMTGQSLFYMGETDLQHKILAIAEEEGVRQAAYALKLLQSDGELTIASTGKDEATGNLVTKQYRVKGPVMLMLTTTAIDVDEELLNRCLVLTVNETREQTQAIHARQRIQQTLEGLLMDTERQTTISLHQNAQRLLKPVSVVNPYANRLTFLDDKTRTRRDHLKYLTLIRAIALLHQHQRPLKRFMHKGQPLEYIEATKGDIELANRLAHELLGRTLDELPPQARRLLNWLRVWVSERCAARGIERREFRFTRRQVREQTRWGDTQLKLYLARLVEMEYLIAHSNGRRQASEYELLYDGTGEESAHLCGLIEPAQLEESDNNKGEWSDQTSQWSGRGRGAVGVRSGGGRNAETQAQLGVQGDLAKSAQKARLPIKKAKPSSPLVAVGA